MEQAEVFRALKPACVHLSNEALKTRSNKSNAKNVISSAQELLHVLDSVVARGQHIDERLVNYVFFPLSHLFRDRDKFPVRSIELALRCLEILLQTGWRIINDPNIGVQLLILLTSLAQGGLQSPNPAGASNELTTASLKCLTEFFRSLERSPNSKRALYDTPNIPAVGHAVTVILDDMKHSVSSEVQMAAADTLHKFCTCAAERDVLRSFAPGIFSALSLALTPSTKIRRSFRFLEKALFVLQDAIQLLLSDKQGDETPENIAALSRHPDTGWPRAAAPQIKLVLANVVKLQQHDRPEVRNSLLNVCWMVLEQCQVTLSSSVPMMIETVIAMSSKEENDGKYLRLQRLMNQGVDMVEYAKSNVYESLVSLPRVVMLNDDNAISTATGQVITGLRILIDSDVEMTALDELIQQTLRGVLLSVIGVSKPEQRTTKSQHPLKILSDDSTAMHPGDFPSILPVNKFARNSLRRLQSLIFTVSRSKGALRMANRALENAHESLDEMRLVNLWICLQILQSKVQNRQEFEAYVNTTMFDEEEDDIRNDLYALAISLVSQSELGKALDWRVQAVALEILAFQASQTQLRFRAELVDTLYAVVHLLGSESQPLRSHAITCLNAMAAACEYLDAKDMLVANADYLVNAVGLQLNALDISPQSSTVLLMMIKLCGPSLLPYLEDLFDSIFGALECFHGYSTLTEQLFAVLESAVDEGVKSLQYVEMRNATPSHRKVSRRHLRMGELVICTKNLGATTKSTALDEQPDATGQVPRDTPQRLWKHLKSREGVVGQSEEDETAETANDSLVERPTEDVWKPTKTHTMLQRIASLTQHHLPSSSATVRISLLSLLVYATPVLSYHDDTFLPLVHTLWPVLLPRLRDKEAFVVAGVLQVMGCICEGAGDFMSTRIEGIWPAVQKIFDRCNQSYQSSSDRHPVGNQVKSPLASNQLEELSTSLTAFPQLKSIDNSDQQTQISADSSRPTSYTSTTGRTIQAALTSFLVQLVSHVRISETMYLEVLSRMLYPQVLNNEKQPPIQEVLRSINADAVSLAIEKETWGDCRERRGAVGQSTRWSHMKTPVDVEGGPRFALLL